MKRAGTTVADLMTAGVVLVLAFAIGKSASIGEPDPLLLRRAAVEPEREIPAAERLLVADDGIAMAAARELAGASGDASPYLRFAALRHWRAEALARLEDADDPGSLAALAELTSHDDGRVAARALLALARRDAERASPLAPAFLDRPVAEVQDDALRAAVVLREPTLVRLLRRICLDAVPASRDIALSALAHTGDGRAADSLRWSAEDADVWDRLRIAESLVRADLDGGIEAWRAALRRLSSEDRAAAIHALRGPIPDAIVAALRDLEETAGSDVRREIRRTLARARTPLEANAVRARIEASVTSFEPR